ncbi:MAG: amidohydrolase family protein [Candidatus Bipolaricaulota bacterium]
MTLIIEKARIADLFGTYCEQGHIVVRDGRVETVGEGPAPGLPDAKHLDAGGRLLTPGLVNAHSHLYSALARGMPLEGYSPSGFRDVLEGLWWRLDRALDKQSIYASAVAGSLAHLRAGVTTVFDHHASPGAIEGSLSLLQQGVDEVGLRAALSYEVTDRGSMEERDAGIAENVRFAREVADNERFAAHMGLHASFTLEDVSLEKATAEAEPLGLPFHMHLAEGKEDPVHALQHHGVRTAERLDQFGILGEGTLLAHGIHLSQAETALLAERSPTVVHNPRSNMNNAVGAPKVQRMLARGIPIGIGTDGLGMGIIAEAFCARLLAHHADESPLALGDEALLSLLQHNYTLAQSYFGVPMGRAAPNYAADLVVWDYHPPTPMDADNVLAHLLFAAVSEGLTPYGVLAHGELLLWEHNIRHMDEHTALARSREAARALWPRV